MARHEFVMENRLVVVEVGRLKVQILPVLNDYFGRYLYSADLTESGGDVKRGKIEQVVLFYGVRNLTVGGDQIKLNNRNPAGSLPDLWGEDPDAEDDDGDFLSIYEKILRLIVQDNPWLHKKQPYGAVFALYAPREEDEEEGNPGASATETQTQGSGSQEDTSSNGFTSITDSEEDLEPMAYEDSDTVMVPVG